ncbi:MAG TPA: DNA mismatch repair endonuclease MutL [Bacteroidales bacterium]|jgi:DNA mismatch repair protein MutL|nr:DNA mismatch repair endonuclease MutL [Bacteroidales bacterium]
MADIIHLLPDSVANQIAAGEVVQRPASVVKELLENSVDAGCTSVKVITRDGGKTLIQVIDNGCGMSDTDARMSFERHATSKIREAADLFAIRTLGFRGEALASAASVSQVVLRTCKGGHDLGTEISIAGSVVESQQPVNCAAGTSITVKNLFYNVPARRKFLKTNNAELKHIIYEFQRVALANPEIAFSLEHNDDELYNLPPANLKQRIVHLFGKSINQNLTDIDTDTSLVKISGFIGKPEYARRTPGEQFFFVNNRFMKHPYFHKAIMMAYEKILPPETLPSYFIFLEADPDSIDINIHPTKTEIKFENEQAIFQILVAATREALGKFNIVPSIDFNNENAIELPIFRHDTPVANPEIPFNPDYNPFNFEHGSGYQNRNTAVPSNWETLYKNDTSINGNRDAATPEQQTLPVEDKKSDTLVQLKNRYILTPVKSGLMLIDQKRAHERILYERYLHSFAMNYPVAQRTLFPETVELDQADYIILKEIIEDLHVIGYDIRDFGSNTIVIAGYPAQSRFEKAGELLELFLEKFKTTGSDIKNSVRERIARSMAVAGSLNYGDTLSRELMQELVDGLFACESPAYSPSGKPVVVIMGIDEIEKRFR